MPAKTKILLERRSGKHKSDFELTFKAHTIFFTFQIESFYKYVIEISVEIQRLVRRSKKAACSSRVESRETEKYTGTKTRPFSQY